MELYADQILDYNTRPNPSHLLVSEVKEIGWNSREQHVYVTLSGILFNGHSIKRDHFANEEEALMFVARANEALQAFHRRNSVQ